MRVSARTEQITLTVWFFLKPLWAWSFASKTKDMGVLKIYWGVMGCQNYQKVRKCARFCKNHNFQVAESQKNFILKGWFTIICKVYCSQKHKIECLSSMICDFIGWWKWDKLVKLRVENPFLKLYIFRTMFWNTLILHKSKKWTEMVPEILKSNNLGFQVPQNSF